jgi:hypothetical protein
MPAKKKALAKPKAKATAQAGTPQQDDVPLEPGGRALSLLSTPANNTTNAKIIEAALTHIRDIQDHPAFAGVTTQAPSEVGGEGSIADQDIPIYNVSIEPLPRGGFPVQIIPCCVGGFVDL